MMDWSFQLFSARHTPIEQALCIVGEAGYTSVEAYRDNFADKRVFQRALDDNELSVPSMHIDIGSLRTDPAGSMQLAREFGSTHIVCPYLDISERPVDTAGWATLAAELSEHAKHWHDAGFEFAWHNHDFELASLPDGAIPMQLLLEHAPELHWELDAAWIVRAGADPHSWISAHKSRLSGVHLKDIAPAGDCADEDGWADLGHGVVPWTTLMPLLSETPAHIYAVEHDNPSDLQRFANRAITTARALRPG